MEDVRKLLMGAKDTVIEFSGIAKLHAMIKAEEAKKQEQYYRLGKKYYELYKDTPESELKEFVNKLLESDEKIAGYRYQLENNKGDEFREIEPEYTEMPSENTVEETTEETTEEKNAVEAEETVKLDDDLEAFLDEKSFEKKLDIFIAMKKKVDKEMLSTIAMSLDFELTTDSIDEQYNEILDCLTTIKRFESSRLR